MNSPKSCPNCGAALPAGALEGLCPACLLAQGADTQSEPGRSNASFQPLPIEDMAKLFPQLEILSLLGAGGMGAVYKARQPALDRLVALKILPPSESRGPNFADRFNREARALARLSHPNIVAVHEFGQKDGLSYFIMEYVDGTNLRQLERAGRLSPRQALQIVPQICDALQYAHDEGVVHRDIKPENVLVDRKGRVKIADFGLAKLLDANTDSLRLTAEGQVMGTPHYMAPEQVERPLAVDHRADIYSLGVVFYEMLTGDLPLGRFSPPSRKVQVDVRLDEVVLRALENNPEHRYQHASDVKSQVEVIASTSPPPVAARPPVPAPARPPPRVLRWAGFPLATESNGTRRVRWRSALHLLAIAFALLTIGFGAVSLISGRSLFAWLGVIGWPSVVVRLALAACILAWGLWQLFKPGGAQRPPGDPRWWSRTGGGVALAALCVVVIGLNATRRKPSQVFTRPPEQTALKAPAPGALLAHLPQGGKPPATPELLAQNAELRFLAWQQNWREAQQAFLPDGAAVRDKVQIELVRQSQPTSCDATRTTPGGTNPPFLHLWFSHPLFDRQSLVSIKLIGDDGTPLPLGASGMMAHNSHTADEHSDGLGWITATLSPGNTNPPAQVNVRLDYALGPLERTRTVAPDFRGGMGLEGNSQLSAIGSDSDGKSFVALSVNTQDLGARQFGVLALTKDGREIAQSGGGSSGPVGGSLLAQRFDFDVPLNQVAHFKIGTRPVRVAEWTEVVLPPPEP